MPPFWGSLEDCTGMPLDSVFFFGLFPFRSFPFLFEQSDPELLWRGVLKILKILWKGVLMQPLPHLYPLDAPDQFYQRLQATAEVNCCFMLAAF